MYRITINLLIAIVLCTSGVVYAQTSQKLTVERATVFIKGAELVSTAKVTLQKGENEVVFSNVAANANNQSIVVNATNGVSVQSLTFQNNYAPTSIASPRIKEMEDSIAIIAKKKIPIGNKIAVLDQQLTMLQNSGKTDDEKPGPAVAELRLMLDLVNEKMEGLFNQKSKAELELAAIDARIAAWQKQIAEEQQKAYLPGGQIAVKLYSREATASNITITYIVPNAGWSPTYDILVDDVKSPVKFYYKANIFQNSGIKWNNVKLTLSTGNPQEGVQAPTLTPIYLAFYVPPVTYASNNTVVTEYKRPLVDKYKQSSIMTAAEIKNSPTTQTNDMAGLSPGVYQQRRGGSANYDGGRSNGNLYVIDGAQLQNSSMSQYVNVDNEGVNTTFDIELPYTIPSDGQQHLVSVKRYEAPATYEYYAAPKADKDAFLMAKITDWQDLNLLPGQTNIFYEGTYIGQGSIDTRNIKDTMSISLGRDKKIVIKRDRDKKLHSVKTIGTNAREEFAYNITVRNTRKESITILLQDQIPVSNDKDIIIDDVELSKAEQDEATGILSWPVTLKGNETRIIKFGYTVKYPKGNTIQ